MGEIINLNRVRKARAKAEAVRQAEVNRVAFGRSKADKRADQAGRAAEESRLDGKRLEDEDEEE